MGPSSDYMVNVFEILLVHPHLTKYGMLCNELFKTILEYKRIRPTICRYLTLCRNAEELNKTKTNE